MTLNLKFFFRQFIFIETVLYDRHKGAESLKSIHTDSSYLEYLHNPCLQGDHNLKTDREVVTHWIDIASSLLAM